MDRRPAIAIRDPPAAQPFFANLCCLLLQCSLSRRFPLLRIILLGGELMLAWTVGLPSLSVPPLADQVSLTLLLAPPMQPESKPPSAPPSGHSSVVS